MSATYGSTSTAHCRPCRGERVWRFAGSENHSKPEVVYWLCTSDGYLRIQLADLPDADGLCRTILNRQLRKTGSHGIDYDDVLGLVWAEMWDLYNRWRPTAGVRFTAYATGLLRLRVNNWWRDELGRDTPKAHSVAVSLDAPQGDDGGSLAETLAARAHDPLADRDPSFGGVLASGGGPGALQRLAQRGD